jgi:hypothetical protein
VATNYIAEAPLPEGLTPLTTDPKAQEMLTRPAIHSPDEEGYSLDKGLIRY